MAQTSGPSRFALRTVVVAATSLAWLALAGVAQASASPPRLDPSYQNRQPPYPDTAQLNAEQGTVVLHVKVGSNGRVRTVRILQSCGFDDLDNAAIEGVMGWRFLPAVHDGDTATEWTDVNIVFRLPTGYSPLAVPPPH